MRQPKTAISKWEGIRHERSQENPAFACCSCHSCNRHSFVIRAILQQNTISHWRWNYSGVSFVYWATEKSCVEEKEMSRYDDIINLPHHIFPTRKRMSMHDRAAQFAPFAALVGYDDAVAETARLTETRPELDEQEQRAINERLAYIADHIHEHPEVRIKYFVPDERKNGGAIVEVSGKTYRISNTDATIVLTDGCKIRLSDIIDLSIG